MISNPQFIGHIGFGLYFIYLGIISFLKAIKMKNITNQQFIYCHFIGSCVFGPFAVFLELVLTKHRFNMENIHHYNMYSLAVIDSLLVLICDIYKIIPNKWRIAYETMLFICAGILFTAHNGGNPLFNGFHQIMLPGLSTISIIHYICELDSLNTKQTLKLIRCLLISIFGTWFINIALGFFLSANDCGFLGCEHDNIDSYEAFGLISYIFTLHFIGWVLFYTILLSILLKYDLYSIDDDDRIDNNIKLYEKGIDEDSDYELTRLKL